MKTIVTLLYGDKYNADDVHRIYDATKQYHHTCIVDEQNAKHLRPEIKQILIEDPEGHWEKIKMFKNDWVGDCLYLDLDVIIQGSLDRLFVHCLQPTICFTYWKDNSMTTTNRRHNPDSRYRGEGSENDPWMQKWKGMYNSSVMAWRDNEARYIYNTFAKQDQYYMTKYCGDDRFLYHENILGSVFPRGLIYSFLGGVDVETDSAPRSHQILPEYPIVLLNGQDEVNHNLRQKYNDALSLHKMG